MECAGASSAALVINLNDHPHVVARVDGEGNLSYLTNPWHWITVSRYP